MIADANTAYETAGEAVDKTQTEVAKRFEALRAEAQRADSLILAMDQHGWPKVRINVTFLNEYCIYLTWSCGTRGMFYANVHPGAEIEVSFGPANLRSPRRDLAPSVEAAVEILTRWYKEESMR
jgi:hypothetical protein